jgi:hypothetical protein
MFTWIIMMELGDVVFYMCRQLVMIPLPWLAVINLLIPQDLPMVCSTDYPTFYLLPLRAPISSYGTMTISPILSNPHIFRGFRTLMGRTRAVLRHLARLVGQLMKLRVHCGFMIRRGLNSRQNRQGLLGRHSSKRFTSILDCWAVIVRLVQQIDHILSSRVCSQRDYDPIIEQLNLIILKIQTCFQCLKSSTRDEQGSFSLHHCC